MASYVYLRRINGKLYDEGGIEYDETGKPKFLRRSPQAQAEYERITREAKEKSAAQIFKTKEQKESAKRVQGLNEKINKLREASFHTKAQCEWYRTILKPDVLSMWLDDLDKNIQELLAYRNHLLDKLCIAEDMVVELDKAYTQLQDQISDLEEQRRAEKDSQRDGDSKKDPKPSLSKAERLFAQLDPKLVEQWRAAGLPVDKLVEQWAAASNS